MNTITLTDFELAYDGIFKLIWKERELKLYLPLSTLLKMIEIEGFTTEELSKFEGCNKLRFSKVKLSMDGTEKDGEYSFYTSEMSEEYFDEGLTFYDVEIVEE